MTATLYDIRTGRRQQSPRLVAAARPHRRPLSATIALFAIGMTPGFLLASVASAQGGPGMVHLEWLLAGVSTLVAVAAATRSRQIARRRQQRLRERAQFRPAYAAPTPLRRAA